MRFVGHRRPLGALLLACCLPLAACEEAPRPTTATAIDGDSLMWGDVEVRLHGIDAPELRQACGGRDGGRWPCGRAARNWLRKLLRRGSVTCRRVTTDRYGRMVGICTVNGRDVGRAMVRAGLAVAYVRYSRRYVADERAARAARRGIWQGQFTLPHLWRRRHRY
ncbi:MAG TPA: thermonuclease family protein [Thermopetrobacter sp.]|nr:thermonuclease family protein [Thermopetrobacter sp.]